MRAFEQHEVVAGLHLARFDDPVVPAAAATVLHAAGHVGHAEAVGELPARLPALGHLDHGRTEAQAVAEADVGFGDAGGADVLAEGAGLPKQRMRADLRGPGRIVVAGVMVDGLVGPAVHAAVALLVAFQAFGTDRDRSLAWLLGDGATAARPRIGRGRAGEHGLDAGNNLRAHGPTTAARRSEEHTSELQSRENLVCRL